MGTKALGLTCCMLLWLAAAGCSSTTFDVNVTVAGDYKDDLGSMPSVEVQIVGANQSEFEKWNNLSVTDYWRQAHKQDDIYEMKFGQGLPNPQLLKKDDPIWQTWSQNGATYLFVIAHMPGEFQDKPGNAYLRRLVLPLKPSKWEGYYWGKDRIEIIISKPPRGLVNQTPPKADK